MHTIGNLTLTGYNSELSDRPYSQKKTIEGGFNDSPIRLNDTLRKAESWREEEILSRAKELAFKASGIWTSPDLTEEQLEYYKPEDKSTAIYSLDVYDYLKGDMIELYEILKKRIMNIDSSVYEEYKKLYIAYKSSTNFVDIVPQKSRLRLSLNIPFSIIIDPKGYCKDITDLGRWGNGDVEVSFENINQLDDVMELIEQAFDKQMDPV
mgnify:FL=1